MIQVKGMINESKCICVLICVLCLKFVSEKLPVTVGDFIIPSQSVHGDEMIEWEAKNGKG